VVWELEPAAWSTEAAKGEGGEADFLRGDDLWCDLVLRSGRADDSDDDDEEDVDEALVCCCCGLGGEFLARSEERIVR